jgi:hypothetical protein
LRMFRTHAYLTHPQQIASVRVTLASLLTRIRYPCVVLALLLRTHVSRAQSTPSPDSIHRLPPASFPSLPISVRRDLERRGCLVPQPSDANTPANVIHGSFSAPKVLEWAILCSLRDSSQILIYRLPTKGDATVIDSLERSSDVQWMQGIGGNRWGFSRLLRVLPLERIRAWRDDPTGRKIPRPIDHDAIEQAFVGKAAEAFYYVAGRVFRRVTAD